MKSSITLIFFLLLSLNLISQETNDKIRWSRDRVLTWDDFQAPPDESVSYSANTNSGISYTWNYSTASGEPVLEHEVFSNFYPDRSWMKEVKEKEYLLAHEQLHFDISELHARKLRQELDNYEIGRTIRLDLKRIYNRIEAERSQMQNRFDRETEHSENKEAEMRWRQFIATELEKLEEYSS